MVGFQSILMLFRKLWMFNLWWYIRRERRKCKSGHVQSLKMHPEVEENDHTIKTLTEQGLIKKHLI